MKQRLGTYTPIQKNHNYLRYSNTSMPKSPKGEPKRPASKLKPCGACEKSTEPQSELCRPCQRKVVAISKTQKYQFGACLKRMLQAKGTEKRLRVLAGKMDRNGDGFVDKTELRQWIVRSFRMLSREDSDEV